MLLRNMVPAVQKFDRRLIAFLHKYSHRLHRVTLGLFFIWLGLLKLMGFSTTTSLLAHTVYWVDPGMMVRVLGYWEIAIGVCLMTRRFVRVAIFLLVLRLPGILMAFILKPEICFYHFPFAPTPEGQYLIKDLVIFFAGLTIAGTLQPDQEENSEPRHPRT